MRPTRGRPLRHRPLARRTLPSILLLRYPRANRTSTTAASCIVRSSGVRRRVSARLRTGYRVRNGAVGARAVADLSLDVVPPAEGGPIHRDSAGMGPARPDRGGADVRPDPSRGGAVLGGPGAELTVIVGAPAVGGPVRGETAGVTPSGAVLRDPLAAGHAGRTVAVGEGSVSQPTVG